LKAKNTEAESWLALAEIFARRRPLPQAYTLARQAAEEFHREQAVHTEVQAQSLMALTRSRNAALPTRSG